MKILFLKWWLFFALMAVGSFIAFQLGIFHEIWDKDVTKLSAIILIMFTLVSLVIGAKTYELSKIIDSPCTQKTCDKIQKIEYVEEFGWFASDMFMNVGMIGTIIGFIMMLSAFEALSISDPKSIQDFLHSLGTGLSTALYTTLTGLISSQLAKIQVFNLSLTLEKVKEKANKYLESKE